MRRYNATKRRKHTTPLKYHERLLHGVYMLLCWQRQSKATVRDIIEVPFKQRRYEYTNVCISTKKYPYTSRYMKKHK